MVEHRSDFEHLTHWPLGDVVVIVRVYSPNAYQNKFMVTSCEIARMWIPQNIFDDQLTLVQIMAWRLAITWTNVDPVLCQQIAWPGHNELKCIDYVG